MIKYAYHKHDIGRDGERRGIVPLVFVEARGDETVYLIDDVRCCYDKTDVETRHHVDNELTGQFCVDESDVWR